MILKGWKGSYLGTLVLFLRLIQYDYHGEHGVHGALILRGLRALRGKSYPLAELCYLPNPDNAEVSDCCCP